MFSDYRPIISGANYRHSKVVVVAVTAVLSLAWLVAKQDSVASPVPASTSIPVRAVTLTKDKPTVFHTFSGTTRAVQRVTVRPQVSGRLEERHIELGDRVTEGQLLISLFNPEASPAAKAARKQWQQAQVTREQRARDFKRINDLFKSSVVSTQENETARTALLAAEAAESSAESQYLRANQVNEEQMLRAPFGGVITDTMVEPGEVVVPGQALLQLADPSQVEIEVAVSERIASVLKRGDPVQVSLPLNDRADMMGWVQQVTPFRERGALPTVVVQLPQQAANPGVTAQLHFAIAQEGRFSIPSTAVLKRGDSGAVVYRITEQDTVEHVAVTPHQLANGHVTVSGDLAIDDVIVAAGIKKLFAGAPVEIVR